MVPTHHCERVRIPFLYPLEELPDRVHVDCVCRDAHDIRFKCFESALQIPVESHVEDHHLSLVGHAGGEVFEGKRLEDEPVVAGNGPGWRRRLDQEDLHEGVAALPSIALYLVRLAPRTMRSTD